jgi:cytochrome c-type biogenesis protein
VAPINGTVSSSNTFKWDLPLPYGLGLVNDRAQSESLIVSSPRTLTWPVFLAIMAGMLTALSPCLLQLAAYYAAVLAGAGAGSENRSHTRRHLVRTSLFFVGGFTLVYTTGGFIAGYVGESMQHLAFIQQWSYPVSVIAGVIIILLAIRIAIQARAPLVCRLPLGVKRSQGSGWVSSAVMGSTFAVGCLTCFSATVLSALLLYAGSTGSPVIGGLLLLLFSAGVGVVFLLAAWVIGESASMLGWLQRAQPIIGGVSALIMVGFGLLMVTYQFHVVSGFLFRLFAPS